MLHSRLVTMRWRLKYTPFYSLLSEHGGHSIEVAPLPTSQDKSSSLNSETMDISPVYDTHIFSTPSQHSIPKTSDDARVLLAVSIANDAIQVSPFTAFLAFLSSIGLLCTKFLVL